MKLIIEVPVETYKFLKEHYESPYEVWDVHDAIKNGIPYEERPQGEWEYNQYDGNPNIGNWHCSECRYIDYGGGYNQKPHYNFCPNCGADMRKEVEK